MRGHAASPMEGTAPLLRGPRRAAVRDGCAGARSPRWGPNRWPAGRGGSGAGAAGWAPASSGGVLASFLVWHVGVSTLSHEARAGMCASCNGNAIFEHTCHHIRCYRTAAGLRAAHQLERLHCLRSLSLHAWTSADDDLCCLWGPRTVFMCSNSLI
jgi:hypothetical protein